MNLWGFDAFGGSRVSVGEEEGAGILLFCWFRVAEESWTLSLYRLFIFSLLYRLKIRTTNLCKFSMRDLVDQFEHTNSIWADLKAGKIRTTNFKWGFLIINSVFYAGWKYELLICVNLVWGIWLLNLNIQTQFEQIWK